MTPLFDAHNHLHDARLAPHLEVIVPAMREAGIERCVVNGTSQDDWTQVADLARRFPGFVQPSFGLHPWKLPARGSNWLTNLRRHLDNFPHSGLGECGLDRWIQHPDFAAQEEVFLTQLALATERNLPLSIHCLQAWGPLLTCLRGNPRPARGFLLHSFGGSAELVTELAPLGAYFSFSGHFLHSRKEIVRAAFRKVPADRLLLETDAPDMLPPPPHRTHPLADSEGTPLNHPANLRALLSGLAETRECGGEALASTLADNFKNFFGS
jgi:TatD DNase family protein